MTERDRPLCKQCRMSIDAARMGYVNVQAGEQTNERCERCNLGSKDVARFPRIKHNVKEFCFPGTRIDSIVLVESTELSDVYLVNVYHSRKGLGEVTVTACGELYTLRRKSGDV